METEPRDQRVAALLSSRELAAIDDWRRRQTDLPNRSEALRRLVDLAINSTKSKE